MNDDLREFIMLILLFLGLGCFVYLFTRVFRFKYEEQGFLDARKSSIDAALALFLGWIAISGLFVLFARMGITTSKHQVFQIGHVVRQIIVSCLFFGPSLIVMRMRNETWSSSGISKHNLGKSLLLGMVLSAFMVIFNVVTKKLNINQVLHTILVPSNWWALATFLIVGSSEEFGFRGYLQTRLVLWLGKPWGWVLASTLMAVGHIIQRITIMGMSGTNAFVSSLALIPISLLFGYIMIRTENVVTSALLHTFIAWNSVF